MHATCLVSIYTVVWIAAGSWDAGSKFNAAIYLNNEFINYHVYEQGLML